MQLRERRRVDGLGRAKFDSTQALTNTNAAPPITTDSEILTELRRTAGDAVVGRLRLVDYMNPQDPLYFDARRWCSLTRRYF